MGQAGWGGGRFCWGLMVLCVSRCPPLSRLWTHQSVAHLCEGNVSMCKRPALSAASSDRQRSWWGSSPSAAGSVESAIYCGRWGGGVASPTPRKTAEEIEGKEEGGWGRDQQHDSGGRGEIKIRCYSCVRGSKMWDYTGKSWRLLLNKYLATVINLIWREYT